MKNTEHPLLLFTEWFKAEQRRTQVTIPSAVCLSTLGLDGFPNARFVSLKEICEDTFIITGPLTSRKGIEMAKNPQVALTFWWPETERQVRIQGRATEISEALSDTYFNARHRHSKAVSVICDQGHTTDNLNLLEKKVLKHAEEHEDTPRPNHWGGHAIQPLRMEFMQFQKTRFHHRTLYVLQDTVWVKSQLQP